MRLLSGISRGAIGLALAASLCVGLSVGVGTSAQAHERFFPDRHPFPVPLPIPLPDVHRGCGWGYHRIFVHDQFGYVVGECCVPDYYGVAERFTYSD